MSKGKLIEIIRGVPIAEYQSYAEYVEAVAEKLTSEGVIVPPCKVGQTVYMPWKWNGVKAIAYLTVTHIFFDRSKSYVKTDFNTDDEDYWSAYNCGEFDFSDFGKTVFLTREEAERVLKGADNEQK